MSAAELLETLRGSGVVLKPNGFALEIDAPTGIVGDELLQSVIQHKHSLIRLLEREQLKLQKADRSGLLIRWSEHPGWIKIHDPLTGDWHEVKASECLPGVLETANKYQKKGGTA
jgi:hypothetical protein